MVDWWWVVVALFGGFFLGVLGMALLNASALAALGREDEEAWRRALRR